MESAKITAEDGSTGRTTVRVQFKIGGQSNKIQAQQEAREFMDPRVFTNRSAVFPNPANFGLTIKTVSAELQPWPNPPSPMNQFYTDLILDITGPSELRIEDWVKRVQKCIKVFMPTAYGSTSDRAQHLKETGRHNPVTQGVAAPAKCYTGTGNEREEHLKEHNITGPQKEGAKVAAKAMANTMSALGHNMQELPADPAAKADVLSQILPPASLNPEGPHEPPNTGPAQLELDGMDDKRVPGITILGASISDRTLTTIDKSAENLKAGRVSEPITIKTGV